MTTFNCSETVFANLAWYRRTKDLVPLFYPKVHLLENSLLKILAQLLRLPRNLKHRHGFSCREFKKTNTALGCAAKSYG